MKWLLVLHFPKPEETLKQRTLKGSEVAELLPALLRHSEASQWPNLAQMPALQQLLACTQVPQVSLFDLQDAVRNAVLDVLHTTCFCETYQFTSRDDDEIFCKVSCDEAVLRHQAHRMHYTLSLAPAVETNAEMQTLLPHAPYDAQKDKQGLFQTYESSLFRDVDKVRLVKALLEEQIYLDRMVEKGFLIDYFPIHEEKQLQELRSTLLTASLALPVPKLREYFGEKTAFYFLW